MESKDFIYDIEVAPNLFMITFINANSNPAIIDAYEKAAIANNQEHLAILTNALGVRTFIVAPNYRNDLPLLTSFMQRHKNLIGYNNNNYDDLILDYICMYGTRYNDNLINAKRQRFNDVIYYLSKEIIDFGKGFHQVFREQYDMQYYKRLYMSKDIQKILYLDKLFVGLKQVGIMLKWYLIQDLPYHPDETLDLTDEVVNKIRFYNINDCIITKKVVDVSANEINLRTGISDMYGIWVHNESRSGIASKYFAKVYCDMAGIHKKALMNLRTYRRNIKVGNILSPKIKFHSPRLQDLLWTLQRRSIVIGSDGADGKLSYDIQFGGKMFKMAKGGLHSKDTPGIYISDKDYVYIDADVTSFYPMIILLLNICPAHLDKDIFLSLVKDIVDNRIGSKGITGKLSAAMRGHLTHEERLLVEVELNKSTTKTEALKIVINAIYGKFGDENSPLYDLQALYETTINGQLFLLMLVDMLSEAKFQNVSANTDGIITKVHRSRLDEFYKVCSEWCEITGFQLEYTNYEKYICYAVNDYIAIKEGFSESEESVEDRLKMYVKRKGLFLTDLQLDKGYFCPVVPKVLEAYYVFGKDIKESLAANTDIYDYCISKKTNSNFNTIFMSVDKETGKVVEDLMQSHNRFYISGVSTGGLTKKYKNPKPNKKGVIVTEIAMVARQNIKMFNRFEKLEHFSDYNIHDRFYYTEIMKITSPIDMSTKTLF